MIWCYVLHSRRLLRYSFISLSVLVLLWWISSVSFECLGADHPNVLDVANEGVLSNGDADVLRKDGSLNEFNYQNYNLQLTFRYWTTGLAHTFEANFGVLQRHRETLSVITDHTITFPNVKLRVENRKARRVVLLEGAIDSCENLLVSVLPVWHLLSSPARSSWRPPCHPLCRPLSPSPAHPCLACHLICFTCGSKAISWVFFPGQGTC